MSAGFVTSVLRALLIIVMIIFACIGVSGKMLIGENNDEYYLTNFEFKDQSGNTHDTSDLGCSDLKRNLRAGAGLGIICIILYAVMLLITIVDIKRRVGFAATNVIFGALDLITWIFILVSWALSTAVYHQDMCKGFTPKDNGMKLGYGGALLVVTWVVQCFVVLLHIIFMIATKNSSADDSNAPDKDDVEFEEVEEVEEVEAQAEDAEENDNTQV